jgi:predicted hydrocarbon binding protein
LACIDEGCGSSEDLVGMMSLSDGVIKSELKEGRKVLDVVKHPKLNHTRIEVPTDKSWEKQIYGLWDRDLMRRFLRAEQNLGEFSVNIFWPAFAFWSSMLWDPKGFPKMNYDVWKEYGTLVREAIPFLPFRTRLFFRSLMPKHFSKVEDMRKLLKSFVQAVGENRRDGFLEYLDDISKTDEHYIRIYENRECWGFENIGTTMAFHFPGIFAGNLKGFEKVERDWNVIETKCIGLGDQYCEFKVVPREIDEMEKCLQKRYSCYQERKR